MNDKKVYLNNLEWTKIKGEWLGGYNNLGIVRGNIIIKDGISYEEFSKLLDNTFYILSNHKLQSNWNSLREWLKELIIPTKTEYGDTTFYDMIKIKVILDKMNELEGEKNDTTTK